MQHIFNDKKTHFFKTVDTSNGHGRARTHDEEEGDTRELASCHIVLIQVRTAQITVALTSNFRGKMFLNQLDEISSSYFNYQLLI